MIWEHLDTASFGGVAFECQSLDDDPSGRRLAKFEFPYRDGAEYEDLGRAGRTFYVRAIFMGPTSEAELFDLLRVIDRGEPADFVHPLLGTFKARVERAPVHRDADAYDFASVELHIVEEGTDATLPDGSAVETIKGEITQEVADLEGLDDTELEEVPSALDEVIAFADAAADAVADLEKLVDKVRSRIEAAIRAIDKLTDVGNWPLVQGLKRLAASCQKLANRVRALKPPLIVKTLETAMPVSLLAHRLYGDGARVDEILRMNRIKDPFFVPAGTQLKVYSR